MYALLLSFYEFSFLFIDFRFITSNLTLAYGGCFYFLMPFNQVLNLAGIQHRFTLALLVFDSIRVPEVREEKIGHWLLFFVIFL